MGILVAVTSVIQFTTSPLYGRLSDAHGRRLFLTQSCLALMAYYIIIGTFTNLVALVVGSIIGGLFSCWSPVISAVSADCVCVCVCVCQSHFHSLVVLLRCFSSPIHRLWSTSVRTPMCSLATLGALALLLAWP